MSTGGDQGLLTGFLLCHKAANPRILRQHKRRGRHKHIHPTAYFQARETFQAFIANGAPCLEGPDPRDVVPQIIQLQLLRGRNNWLQTQTQAYFSLLPLKASLSALFFLKVGL